MNNKKSLLTEYPEIAKEWHPIKNGDLTPDSVMPKSNRKAWWIGKCGHEWESVVASRVMGAGCPYCSGNKVLCGFNDLATLYPDLANEWHPSKNQDLTPSMVSPGSEKIVWWLGPCGHEYKQRIANRKHGMGCPHCRSKKISQKVREHNLNRSGSLALSYPEIAAEWHPTKNGDLTPDTIVGGYGKSIWWLGRCGHEREASPANRIRGTGCPICANQKVLEGFNDLKTMYPEIAAEWHPTKNADLLPIQVVAKSNKSVWWFGKCGHEWKAPISKRTREGHGCPVCARKLQTSFPEQAFFYYLKKAYPDTVNAYRECFNGEMEIDIFIPSISVGIEYDGANWHVSPESRSREVKKYQICRETGIKLIRIREETSDSAREICEEWINAVRHPTHKKLDEEINQLLALLGANVNVDTERDDGAIRAQYFTGSTSKPFGDVYPELLEEWDYEKNGDLDPHSFSVSSGAFVWWKCKECGYEWKTRIATRTAGHGCQKCGVKKRAKSRIANRLKQEGSLADHYPEIAKEWHPTKNDPLKPEMILYGSGKRFWWKCNKCGREWEATPNHRTRGVCGCPNCSNSNQLKITEYDLDAN